MSYTEAILSVNAASVPALHSSWFSRRWKDRLRPHGWKMKEDGSDSAVPDQISEN